MMDELQKAMNCITLPEIKRQSGKAKSVDKGTINMISFLSRYAIDEDEETREIALEMLERLIKVTKK